MVEGQDPDDDADEGVDDRGEVVVDREDATGDPEDATDVSGGATDDGRGEPTSEAGTGDVFEDDAPESAFEFGVVTDDEEGSATADRPGDDEGAAEESPTGGDEALGRDLEALLDREPDDDGGRGKSLVELDRELAAMDVEAGPDDDGHPSEGGTATGSDRLDRPRRTDSTDPGHRTDRAESDGNDEDVPAAPTGQSDPTDPDATAEGDATVGAEEEATAGAEGDTTAGASHGDPVEGSADGSGADAPLDESGEPAAAGEWDCSYCGSSVAPDADRCPSCGIARTRTRDRSRDSGTAALLSLLLVPGLGNLYADEGERAVLLFAGYVGWLLVGWFGIAFAFGLVLTFITFGAGILLWPLLFLVAAAGELLFRCGAAYDAYRRID